jgi:hypothetical protein
MPEFRSRKGRVCDRLSEILGEWLGFLAILIGEAMEEGALPPGTDTRQLAFELTAVLEYADLLYVLEDDREALERARGAIERLLQG